MAQVKLESVKPHTSKEAEYIVELSNGERFITTKDDLWKNYYSDMEYNAFIVMFAEVFVATKY